jgi:hypothetical protein
MADIVLRICLEHYLPNRGITARASGGSLDASENEGLMEYLRWAKETEADRPSFSAQIVTAVRAWLKTYVAAVDPRGAVWTDEPPPERIYAQMPSPSEIRNFTPDPNVEYPPCPTDPFDT